jgi:hypothetical protein
LNSFSEKVAESRMRVLLNQTGRVFRKEYKHLAKPQVELSVWSEGAG